MPENIESLKQLLFALERLARHQERVSLGMVIQMIGRRSFAPVLLIAGLILFSPLSGIPGLPTLMALLVLLVAIQMLLMRRHLWLPEWLLRRSIPQDKLLKTLHWLEKPADLLDRGLKPRLHLLVHRIGTLLTALLCCAIALLLPVMEVVPFSASIAGLALTAFGLALVAHDGFLEIVAFTITGLTVGSLVYYFFL